MPATNPRSSSCIEAGSWLYSAQSSSTRVNVRFWAELGRARLPLAEAVALGTGAIVDLDKEPDEAVDVYVNGTPFARGTLLLVDGEWAVRLEEILASTEAVEHASSSGSEA